MKNHIVVKMNTLIGALLFGIFIATSLSLFIFLLKLPKKIKYAVIILAGIAMIAQSSRMISQGLFFPGSVYQPGLFDLLFDWFTLLFLGGFVAWYGFTRFYKDTQP